MSRSVERYDKEPFWVEVLHKQRVQATTIVTGEEIYLVLNKGIACRVYEYDNIGETFTVRLGEDDKGGYAFKLTRPQFEATFGASADKRRQEHKDAGEFRKLKRQSSVTTNSDNRGDWA